MYFLMQSDCTKKMSNLLASLSNELFHLVQIGFQGFPARGGEAVFGAGDAAVEKLAAAEIAGGLQLLSVHAEVAVGGFEHAFEIVETQRVIDGERTDDAEAQTLVNQAIEFRQFAGRAVGAGWGNGPRGMRRVGSQS